MATAHPCFPTLWALSLSKQTRRLSSLPFSSLSLNTSSISLRASDIKDSPAEFFHVSNNFFSERPFQSDCASALLGIYSGINAVEPSVSAPKDFSLQTILQHEFTRGEKQRKTAHLRTDWGSQRSK